MKISFFGTRMRNFVYHSRVWRREWETENYFSGLSEKKLRWFSQEFPGTRIPVTLCRTGISSNTFINFRGIWRKIKNGTNSEDCHLNIYRHLLSECGCCQQCCGNSFSSTLLWICSMWPQISSSTLTWRQMAMSTGLGTPLAGCGRLSLRILPFSSSSFCGTSVSAATGETTTMTLLSRRWLATFTMRL